MKLVPVPFDYLIGISLWAVGGIVVLVLLLFWRGGVRQNKWLLRVANFGLAVWFTLALLTLIEFGFALIYDRTDAYNMTNVSERWFQLHAVPQMKPLHFENGYGILYRDHDKFGRINLSGTKEVVFLGDSFTFGHGIANLEDRFSNRVGVLLGDSYSVHNLANTGVDLNWCEIVLENLFADNYRIDTVVCVICLNDIEVYRDEYEEEHNFVSAMMPKWFPFKQTYLLNFLYVRYLQIGVPELSSYFTHLAEYYEGEPYVRMKQRIRRLKQHCDKGGSKFRLVVFPFLHTMGENYAFREAHRKLTEDCNAMGVPTLDLLPILEEHRDEGLILHVFDPHPNERANELIAPAISDFLLDHPD